jgi:hypothetical protein
MQSPVAGDFTGRSKEQKIEAWGFALPPASGGALCSPQAHPNPKILDLLSPSDLLIFL